MPLYPYDSVIILTDDIFSVHSNGSLTGTASGIKQAAYWMAEAKISEGINSFLLPTIVTGTYDYSSQIILDYTWVDTIYLTRFIDFEGNVYHTIEGTANIYLSLDDDERGLVDLAYAVGNCACHTHANPYPYKVQMVYRAGLPSGVSFRPDMLVALSTYATIAMNELIGYGNEAPGDIGVQEFANQEYKEKRVKLMNTVFGNSPQAMWIRRNLTRFIRHRYVRL